MEKKMKLITIGGVALLVLCLILGFALTYKGTPEDAKELLTYASELIDETKYVSGKINSEIKGVQEEINVDMDIENEYTYDVRTDVCKAELKYSTVYGEAEVKENMYIWNVGETEKDKTVYYAYTQTKDEDVWYKEKIAKTNDEIYRLNIFELILQNKCDMKLKEKTKNINDQECYVVEAKIPTKVADIITSEVDVLTAISEDHENTYILTLYFNKKWEPVKLYMDFKEEVVADGEKDGLAVVMDKAFYEQEFVKFKSFKKLELPSSVKKDAVEMVSSGGETDTETPKNEFVYEYPLMISDENTSAVQIAKIDNLVIDTELTSGDYGRFYLDNIKEYNYLESYVYNYSWVESNEQALELLLESVSNLEEFIVNEEGYSDIKREETKKSTVNNYEITTVDMTYKYDESLFHQTDAFVKLKDKEFMRITVVVVTGFEDKNPVNTDALIEKFVKAMKVIPQEEVTE